MVKGEKRKEQRAGAPARRYEDVKAAASTAAERIARAGRELTEALQTCVSSDTADTT